MTHALTIRENGKVEMAYIGETPWHGLGSELEPGASIEAWIDAAGMDWKVQRSRVRYAVERGVTPDCYREYENQVVLFRSDTKAPLGLASDGFQIVQPRDTIEFFRDLVDSAGGTLSTAGTMFGGRKFWAMATFGDEMPIADSRDTVRRNLLLATASDGSMATTGTWIATRVVCNNTLQIGLGETNALRVKVYHRSKFEPKTVKAELGIEQAQSVFDRTIADMRRLTAIQLKPAAVVLATAQLFSPGFAELDSDARDKLLRSKPVEAVGKLALDGAAIGSDMRGTAGTAYGWLNAVTEYVDHAGRARTVDARLDSAWFGKGAELKERAFAMALAGGSEEERPSGSAVDSVNDWLSRNS